MNLKQFQALSRRTMPFGGSPTNDDDFRKMLGEYAMGIVGESLELYECIVKANSLDDFKKELGDIAHYGVGIAALINFDAMFILTSMEKDSKKVLRKLLIASKDISELVKKHIYHDHDLPDLTDYLIDVLNSTFALSHAYHIDFTDVLQTNIDKLKIRYPESFNTEDSRKRVDVDGMA